jgi:hypothetical protein
MPESSEFFKLIDHVERLLHPPGAEKVASLFVHDAEWPGVDAWIERWRDQPWPERPKGRKPR